MSYFEFPHTRSYEGDLGFVIQQVIKLTEEYNTFFKFNTITFADPIEWDITRQYPAFQIVFDTANEASYISKQPVPKGITLENSEYWSVAGSLLVDGEARTKIERILHFISNIYEPNITASELRTIGEYLIVFGDLYKVVSTINAGEIYTPGYNIEKTTIEAMVNDIVTSKVPHTDLNFSTISYNPIANKSVTTRFNEIDTLIIEIRSLIDGLDGDIANLSTDIGNETAARQLADVTINSRIDNLIQLEPGSTTGDAELQDIRLTEDGTTYPTAGAAVRAQTKGLFDLIKSSIDLTELVKILNVNIFPTTGYTDGHYLNYGDGRDSVNANWFYTDYIPVDPARNGYTFDGVQSASVQVCFYDLEKKFLSGVLNTPGTEISMPAAAVYMRASFLISGRTNLGLYITPNFNPTAQGTSQIIEALKSNALITNVTPVLPTNYTAVLPDLDSAADNSIYLVLASAFAIDNIPLNIPYGIYLEPAILITSRSGGYKKQLYIGNTGIFARVYSGGSWQSWTIIKKPVIEIPNGKALVLTVESGIPVDINLKVDVNLYNAYISTHGVEYWNNYVGYSQSGNRNDSGLYLHPHVNFNGNGHIVSFVPDIDRSAVQRDFSPFNLAGDNILENVTINIGYKHCRYAVHDDFAISTESETIRNVTMIGTGFSPALLGSGVKPYCHYTVENCLFLDNQDTCDILYHSSTQNVQAASYLVIRDCYCQKSIHIKYVGINQVNTPCLVSNNKAHSIEVLPGSGETPYQNMTLYAWNNDTEV